MTVTELPHISSTDRCRTCAVRHLGFCNWFDDAKNREIARKTRRTTFAAGGAILDQGEAAQRVGIILSGLVKIVLVDEEGDEHLIQLLHAGEMVGDPFSSVSAYSWQAATDCELCWLPPGALAAAIRESPAAYGRQLEAMMGLVQEQRFAQIALRGRNSLQRVAHWLFLQIPPEATPTPVRLRIVLTRRDLASLLEMTVETLCRALHQVEERGAIRLAAPDLVDLRDRALLRRLCRGHDDQLQQTLLQAGWEWGARPVGIRAVPNLIPRKPGNATEAAVSCMTSVKDSRRPA